MDPVASGLTILSTIRTSLKVAKRLYKASEELDKLQAEVDTSSTVLNEVVADTHDLRKGSKALERAVTATQACLIEIKQLIEFELVKEVGGKKQARRIAWARNVERIRALTVKLAEQRGHVQLALCCDSVKLTKTCEETLGTIHNRVQQHYGSVEQRLLDHADQNRRQHSMLMEKLEAQDRRLESQCLILDNHRRQYHQLEAQFAKLLEAPERSTHCVKQLEYHTCGHLERPLERSPSPKMLPPTWTECTVTPGGEGLRSTSLIGQVKSWMSHCNLHHAACVKSWSSDARPTRLLSIGDEFSDVFLVDSTAWPSLDYAALSYTWGETAAIVTTTSSLASRKNLIPWNSLPRVFKDVIQLLRKLQIRYLWIDALCILQDSVEDWEREVSMMAMVYQNAEIVIVAHSTATSSFDNQIPASIVHSDLRHPDDASTSLTRVDPRRSTVTEFGGFTRSRWWCRGWTMQERLLATRLLHMRDNELYWECNHSIAPLGTASANESAVIFQQPSSGLKVLTSDPHLESMSAQQTLEVWWPLVEQYSSRQLSHPSDKLIALSGMASKFEAKMGRYVAGIWIDRDLAWNLSWRVDGTTERYSSYVAPTWSWASISGSICKPRSTGATSTIALIDFETGQLGVNKFGAVSNAHLTLKGLFVEAIVTGFEWEDEQCLIHLKQHKLRITIASDVVEVARPGTVLVLLKILEESNGDAACLLLRSVLNEMSEMQTWQRMALLSLSKDRGEKRWFKDSREGVFRLV